MLHIVHKYIDFIPRKNKRVRNYLNINLKFHDYSRYFTDFDVATYINKQMLNKNKLTEFKLPIYLY